MRLHFDSLKCTACMACELACGYHRDDAFSSLTSSIVTYRNREKKNYFGIVLKEAESLVLARPEGLEILRIGVVQEGVEADPAAKPILLREACDLCQGIEGGPLCIRFCPQNVISLES
jgi:ferredoxin